jgi:GDPmannose 4,6-dehydratase
VEERAIIAEVVGDKAPGVKVGDTVVRVDPNYFRPAEVETLLGDPSLAKKDLGWIPEVTLDQMVEEMVASDLAHARQHALLHKHGYVVPVSKES